MNIKDLDHLRNDKRIRFAEEVVNGETLTIVHYMVADASLWEFPLAIECRGIVFNSEGECISRPLHKFFNIGENKYTQLQDIQDGEYEILEKRDGSLLTPVLVKGELFWKTKKSFYSDVAVEAAKNASVDIIEFSKELLELNCTPCFEYTSQYNEVVIDYGAQPKFVLIAIRGNDSGVYLSYSAMGRLTRDKGIELIKKHDMALQDCLEQAKTLENFEGWCLRNVVTGFYVKQKTAWYLRNHRAKTDLRERDIADMCISETLDDIKSSLSLDGFNLTPIEEIEKRVVDQLNELRYNTEQIADSLEDKKDFKAAAIKFKNNKYFGLLMPLLRDQEVDYAKFWIKEFRDGYSLKSVYNSNF